MSSNQTNSGIQIDSGFYTIVYPNGEHRTMQIKSPKEGYFAGKQIIGFLSGSDNTSSYTFFGTIDYGQIYFWKKWSDTVEPIKVDRVRRAIHIINEGPEAAGKAYAMNSGHCYVCNRLLTHPESILTGIGPECSKRKATRRAA